MARKPGAFVNTTPVNHSTVPDEAKINRDLAEAAAWRRKHGVTLVDVTDTLTKRGKLRKVTRKRKSFN